MATVVALESLEPDTLVKELAVEVEVIPEV